MCEKLQNSFLTKYLEDSFIKLSLKNFSDNDPIFSSQSGFEPDDSCINQLIAITHDIVKGFDDGLEEAFFLIYIKYTTKNGKRDLFITYVVKVFVENYYSYC